MKRSVLSAAALILFSLLLAAPDLRAAPPADPMVALGRLTAGSAPFLRVACGKNASSLASSSIVVRPIEIGPPEEGYPIDLGNGCGCPTLGWPWRYDGNTCQLQRGGGTCTGVCAWVRTLPNGYEVGYPTQCGTL